MTFARWRREIDRQETSAPQQMTAEEIMRENALLLETEEEDEKHFYRPDLTQSKTQRAIGNLPPEMQAMVELRRANNIIAAQIAETNWGKGMDRETRRAIAEWGRRHEIDVTRRSTSSAATSTSTRISISAGWLRWSSGASRVRGRRPRRVRSAAR
jgi:hypothetical protein